MPITTERLALRPYVRSDAEALGRAVRGAYQHLQPWMPWASTTQSTEDSLEVIAGMIAEWVHRTDLTLGIFDRTTGELLGGSGLHRMDWGSRCFEVGYWIRPEHEGRGFVTETVRALTIYCFDQLRAARVEVRLDPVNARSKAIPERLGFVHEGTLRQNALATSGDHRDTAIYAMLPTDNQSKVR